MKKTAKFISRYRGEKIALGVSGGRDSMCLLHAVLHCGAVDRSSIIVVHVNHGLRETADADEQFVRDYCDKNGVACSTFRIDVKRESAEKGHTIEQAARNLRYAVFYDLIKSRVADYIMTAHHALDNAESILMHLFRGAGLDGVRGMANEEQTANGAAPLHLFRGAGLDGVRGMANGERSANGAASQRRNGSRILRPFIDVYPDDLDEYQRQNNIEYVVDDTNFRDDADRNFIRLNVIPMIEKRYRGAVRAVNEFARECADACEYLDCALDDTLICCDRDAVVIADEALTCALAARYVRRVLERFSLTDITRAQTIRVVELVGMRTGATIELANGVTAAREYGGVALFLPRPKCAAVKPVAIGLNVIDGLAIDIEYSDVSPESVKGGAVDFALLSGAQLRFRRDGDMFTPYGGKRKKLKQYFIDKKIPKRLRDRMPLICRGDEVLVVVGVEISDKVKQTDDTKEKTVIRQRW